ncbi:MAG TPA: hypothetical protein V6D19_08115 [Stenomitos sp.]
MEQQTVNCAEACVNGCILGDACPHREHVAAASSFIQNKSMDEILAIAEESVRKKITENTQRYLPDLPTWPN